MKTKQHAYMALKDFIREVATPKWIYSDNAGEETGQRWISILRKYCISGPRTSEPYCPHQNRAERWIQDVKRLSRYILK